MKEPTSGATSSGLPPGSSGAPVGASPMPEGVDEAAARYREGAVGGGAPGAGAAPTGAAGEDRGGPDAEVVVEINEEELADAIEAGFGAVEDARGNGAWALSRWEKRLLGKVSAARARQLGVTPEKLARLGFGGAWGLVLGIRVFREVRLIRKAVQARNASAGADAPKA